MTDVPVPELGHNDLLIKIRKTAICGLTFTSITGMVVAKNHPGADGHGP